MVGTVHGVELVISPAFPVLLVLSGTSAALVGQLLVRAGWEPVSLWVLVPTVVLLHMLASLVHESGHVLAARLQRLCWIRLRFTPMGFAVTIADTPDTPLTPRRSALLALAGPAVGLLLALVLGGVALDNQGSPLGTVASVTCLLVLLDNAVNLLPLPGLDGGQAAQGLRTDPQAGVSR